MVWHPRFNYTTLAAAGLASLLLNILPLTTLSAHAQSDDPNQGLPPGTVGGGSRAVYACGVQTPLVAFMPETHVLKTVETRPSLWVYLPDVSSLVDAEFILYDDTETAVVDTVFSVAEQSGLVQIDLAAIARTDRLESDQHYRWFFSLICPDNRAADISVDGWLYLTPLPKTLADQLNCTNNPVKQASLYLEAGMWSEALATLVTWHESSSTTVSSEAWSNVIDILSPVTFPLNLTSADSVNIGS